MSLKYTISDHNKMNWGDESTHPNITLNRADFDDRGLRAYGWEVRNRDEGLDRYLFATFVWEGSATDSEIVQAQVDNVRGCHQQNPMNPFSRSTNANE